MPCRAHGLWLVDVVADVGATGEFTTSTTSGSTMSIVGTPLRANCSATTDPRLPAPTMMTRRPCTVRCAWTGRPATTARRKGFRSPGDSTPIVLNYPSRVSLYRVGCQVRVDLEGVAEGDSVLAGGPRMAQRVGGARRLSPGVNSQGIADQRRVPSRQEAMRFRAAAVSGVAARSAIWLHCTMAAHSSTGNFQVDEITASTPDS